MERTEHSVETTASVTATPRAVSWWSIALFAGAIGALAGFAAAGAPWPPAGPALLLAVVSAFCVNRFAFFPSEHAATAEAAVVLAAVVGFRLDAPVLGPLVVALLMGPLDALHWEQRSFLRMAYNSGNRGLAALAAVAAFAGAEALRPDSTVAWVVMVLAAVGAFALVDMAVSAVLLRLHGETFPGAVAHLLDVDVLTVPIAAAGAVAGLLADQLGWWAAALALLPIAFVPELVVARAHARAAAVRNTSAFLGAIALCAVVALVADDTAVATIAWLCLLAVVVGAELGGGVRDPVPALVTILVVAAGLVLDHDVVRVGAVLVAIVATTTSWWGSGARRRAAFAGAVVLAVVASLLAVQVALASPVTASGTALGALVVGGAFATATLVGGHARRRRAVAVVWSAPVAAAAIAGAMAWRPLGSPGVLVFAGAIACALIGWVWWGAPAWRSRLARHATIPVEGVELLAVVLGALGAVALSTVGVLADRPATAAACAWSGIALAECCVGMVAAGVWQWRFASRPRIVDVVAAVVASIVLLGGAGPLAATGSWAGPLVLAATLLVVAPLARTPAKLIRKARARRDEQQAHR